MIFRALEEATTSNCGTPMLDGGNSGNTKMETLSMKKERYLMSMEEEITREEMSSYGTYTMVRTNNGTLSTPIKKTPSRSNSRINHSLLSVK